MRKLVTGIFAVVAWMVAVSPSVAEEKGVASEIEPYVLWSGSNTAISETQYRVITTPRGWTQLWRSHRPHEQYFPSVNFDLCMAVGIFAGKCPGDDPVIIHSITERGKIIQIRFRVQALQHTGKAAEVTTFALFVVPKKAGAVVFEEDTQANYERVHKKAIWIERARIKVR